jgi:hypothetical protein
MALAIHLRQNPTGEDMKGRNEMALLVKSCFGIIPINLTQYSCLLVIGIVPKLVLIVNHSTIECVCGKVKPSLLF